MPKKDQPKTSNAVTILRKRFIEGRPEMEALVEKEHKRVRQTLEREVLRGLESGPSKPSNAEDCDAIRQEIKDRADKRGSS